MIDHEYKLEGLDGVLEMLQKMPKEVVSKTGGPVRAALRNGARVIAREAAINLYRATQGDNLADDQALSTGLLAKNLVVTRGKAPADGKGERYLVRIRRKNYVRQSKETVTTLKSAQLLEYGAPGNQQQAEPWLRPAFHVKAREAIEVARRDLLANIEKIARRLLSKSQKRK